VQAGYSLGILLSVREAEARVLHVPRCGRDSAGIAPYIALTVLFCPGCALKNNAAAVAAAAGSAPEIATSREPRVRDLKIPFNSRRVRSLRCTVPEKSHAGFAPPPIDLTLSLRSQTFRN
jgi:hypothetical protein